MQRKHFLFASAALALIMSSCSDEMVTDAVNGDGFVTFTAQLPEGVNSRAYSDGEKAQTLKYAVYESGKNTIIYSSDDANAPVAQYGNKNFTLSLPLVKGQTYDLIFWAEAAPAESATSPYTFDPQNQTISIDYTNIKCNDESRDAFFSAEKGLLVTGAMQKNIELYRPFAQLNIGTNDIAVAEKAGTVLGTTSVKVKSVYSKLNLFTGVASEAKDVVFGHAELPAGESFPVTGYDYLSMNYILTGDQIIGEDVNQAQKETKDITIAIKDENEKDVNSFDLSAVPFQRNYRTNIYGALLTSTVDYTIEIIPDYNKPDYDMHLPVVTTPESFIAALGNGGAVIPEGATIDMSDIIGDMTGIHEITEPAEIVVYGTLVNDDGGQFKISSDVTISGTGTLESSRRGMLWLVDGGKLNVSGVTINTPAHDRGAGTWITGGEATYENVTFNSGSGTINTQPGSNAKVTMKNCTVDNTSSNIHGAFSYALNFNDGEITLEGNTVNAIQGAIACVSTAKVTIISGTYSTHHTEGKTDAHGALYVSGDAIATVKGGSFYSPRKNYAITAGDNDVNMPYGEVKLYGGYFSDKPWDSNTDRGRVIEPAEGYEYAETGDATYPWAVKKINSNE